MSTKVIQDVLQLQTQGIMEGSLGWQISEDEAKRLVLPIQITYFNQTEPAGYVISLTIDEAHGHPLFRDAVTEIKKVSSAETLAITCIVAQVYVRTAARSFGRYRNLYRQAEDSLRNAGFSRFHGIIKQSNQASIMAHTFRGGMGYSIQSRVSGLDPSNKEWFLVSKSFEARV